MDRLRSPFSLAQASTFRMSTPSIGIGITTKDRWNDLANTLERLSQNGFGALQTIVIDDGSETSMPDGFRERFPWVRFERCEISRGCIVQRNRLAEMLATELYLSLDDDSYPAPEARLDHAAAWLAAKDDAVAVGFAIQMASEDTETFTPRSSSPYPVRYYIGCAHMLKRELFRRLGGYTEALLHWCEETDFALKAWKEGFKIYKYPSVVVIHESSLAGRNSANANRLLTRNLIWVASWRSPIVFFAMELLFRVFWMFRFRMHRLEWQSVIRGYIEAIVGLRGVAHFRDPLSLRTYSAWLKNPVELC